MTTVSTEDFYKILKATTGDIMPKIVNNYSQEIGYIQEWRNVYTRELFGISHSGNSRGQNKIYQINK